MSLVLDMLPGLMSANWKSSTKTAAQVKQWGNLFVSCPQGGAVEVGLHITFPRKVVQREELRVTVWNWMFAMIAFSLSFQKCKYKCLGVQGDNSFK